nr:sigma-70 family RNA polymerase sigma factor [Frigoribacterium sp. CFBP 8766]
MVARVARGDATAFHALFDRHTKTIFRYAWGLAENRTDVDDLVQETFLVAWKKRADLRVISDSLLPWLLVTCRNASLNLARSRRRHESSELVDELPNSSAWHQKQDRDSALDQLEWVLAEIEALPAVDRRLCELCLIDGRSYEEAATFLGLTPASARKRIQRSRQRLRTARATDY